MRKPIDAAWKSLCLRYSRMLGMKEGDQLTELIDDAGQKQAGESS